VPELPEVETLRRDAAQHLIGRRVREATVLAPEVVRAPSPAQFPSEIAAAAFSGARRRAKHLMLDLDNGRTLALQLALFGQLLLREPGDEPARDPDTLVSLALSDGGALDVLDRSRYTRIALGTLAELGRLLKLDELGPEPLDPSFTVEALAQRLGGRRARLKGLLLDQRVVAGLGNIYVDEALWQARLHPARAANSLSSAELGALHRAIQEVLNTAIANRGTTFHTYRDLVGEKGRHQDHLAVFHRQGLPCPRCGTPIERVTIASRDTHLCPHCQGPNPD
jgi:formamidopyrimidine-DNA glycosylase